MISTKHLNFKNISSAWIFETYLNLDCKLIGQSINIRSVFVQENNPSMWIFYSYKLKKYMFKDFSSGHYGDGINLISLLYNIPLNNAIFKVMEDFKQYQKTNIKPKPFTSIGEIIVVESHYSYHSHQTKPWTELDAIYWAEFNITAADLNRYNIKALQEVSIIKDIDQKIVTINKPFMYGYFKKDGTLYKVYIPKSKKTKFLKIKDYIQGSEQLEGRPYLLIVSSMKDLLTFNSLKFQKIECIAPDSETSYLDEETIEHYKSQYKKIIVLFDNDKQGRTSAKKYEIDYGLNTIDLKLEKDLSDSVKMHGALTVKKILHPLIKKTL